MKNKTALIVHNPTSGQIWSSYKPENAQLALSQKGWKVDIVKTEYANHAREISSKAAKDKYYAVIASGGDGTINEVIQGLAGTETILGVLPTGTTNVLARDLNINSYKEAIDAIEKGFYKKIDLGLINGRYFALMVGVGFDAKVMKEVDSNFKKFTGLVAVVTTSPLSMVNHQQSQMSIVMWDKHGKKQKFQRPSYQVVISNSSTYGNSIKIANESSIYDGLLDVNIFKSQDRFNFSKDLISMAFFTKKTYDEACENFKASKIIIKSNPPMQIQVDGDSFGTTPANISIKHRNLSLFMPETIDSQNSTL